MAVHMAQLKKILDRLRLPIRPPNLMIQSELNRGAFGVVHEGVFDGKQVAVKGVHKLLLEAEGGENALRSFCDECERLKELEHPHVIKFLGAFKDAKLGPLLVMERLKENLQQFLNTRMGKLTIQEQIRISLEITRGVAFLHQLSPPMVHGDLNDKNVMFTFDGVAKIGDFGQSKLKNGFYLRTTAPGMVSFMPPEALRPGHAKYDESLDVFSLGVLMLEIGTQQQPTSGLVGIGTTPEVKRRVNDLGEMSDLHPLKPFILFCLSDDQKQRPKATELEKVLPNLEKDILQTMIAAEDRFCKLKMEMDELVEVTKQMQLQIQACTEDFHAERHDRELAHGRFIQKQQEWEDQLEEKSQEHERLTVEVLMLKEKLVEDTREQEGKLSEAKGKMGQMMTALEKDYQSTLAKKDARICALEKDNGEYRRALDQARHVAMRTDGDTVKDPAKHSKRFHRFSSRKVSKAIVGKDAGREKQRQRSQSASSGVRRRVDNVDHEELPFGTTEHVTNDETDNAQ